MHIEVAIIIAALIVGFPRSRYIKYLTLLYPYNRIKQLLLDPSFEWTDTVII